MSNTNTMLLQSITKKRDAHKRKMERKADENQMALRKAYIKQAAEWDWTPDQIAEMMIRGEYKVQRDIRDAARKFIKKIPNNATEFEITKALEEVAEEWDRDIITKRAPSKDKDEMIDELPEEDLCYNPPIRNESIIRMEKTRRAEDIEQWKKENPITTSIKGGFYLVINLTLYKEGRKIRITSDSRKKGWSFNPKTKKRVWNPEMTVKRGAGSARMHAINLIINRWYGKTIQEELNVIEANRLPGEEALKVFMNIMKETEMQIIQSSCLVKDIHRKGEEEFPAVFITVQPRMSAKTRWSINPMFGPSKHTFSTRELTELNEEQRKAIQPATLSHYQMEEEIVRGTFDQVGVDLKDQGLQEKMTDEAGDNYRGKMSQDLSEGISLYVSICRSLDRDDLVEHAMSAKPELTFTPEIAEILFYNHLHEEEALEEIIGADPEGFLLEHMER